MHQEQRVGILERVGLPSHAKGEPARVESKTGDERPAAGASTADHQATAAHAVPHGDRRASVLPPAADALSHGGGGHAASPPLEA